MRTLDSVSCANAYTAAAKIDAVYNSSGGYFAVTGADAYAQLFYGRRGQELATAEFHVPVGVGILYPGTVGIQFRNYTTGQTAVVSAALSNPSEPSVVLSAGGIATPAVTNRLITGRVSGAGAIISGTGYTPVRTALGIYTITFTTPFAAAPVPVVTSAVQNGIITSIDLIVTTGFRVENVTPGGVSVDQPFTFLVAETA
jgi:hypothetical protein